jgi:hypothetical protein
MNDDLRSLARERSHHDARAANDLFRAAAQAVILINGGAATALIAFAEGKGPLATVPNYVAIALILYAIGAMLGAAMTFAAAQSAQYWLQRWELVALGVSDKSKSVQTNERAGDKWSKVTRLAFLFGVLFFAIATIGIAATMIHREP